MHNNGKIGEIRLTQLLNIPQIRQEENIRDKYGTLPHQIVPLKEI